MYNPEIKVCDYESLDEMAAKEGVLSVLKFLAHNPTIVHDKDGGVCTFYSKRNT